ncbi:MAG TPA: hypothetical protein VIJ35_23340 [Bradyrhizobium sp.]
MFNENVTYGYRRNLFALKWPALMLNGFVVLLCIWAFSGGVPFSALGQLNGRILVVFAVAIIHALYIGLAVNKRSVSDGARSYARQLILSCESFLGKEKPVTAAAKKSARGGKGKAGH